MERYYLHSTYLCLREVLNFITKIRTHSPNWLYHAMHSSWVPLYRRTTGVRVVRYSRTPKGQYMYVTSFVELFFLKCGTNEV